MRDVDKLREKIELSLDNKQVVSLVIGLLVVLGVVFVLGVMVGKQLAPQGQAAPQDLLGTLDRAAVADAGSQQVALTFQQELTKPVTAPTVPAPPPAKARAAEPADRPQPKVEPHPEPKAEVAKAEPKPDDDADAQPEVAKPEPVAPPAAAQARPAPTPSKPAESAPPPALDKKLADAFSAAKKDKPKQEAAVAPPVGGFTVQVAASQAKDEADNVLQKLRGSGLRPYMTDAEIPGKGHWYRVRLGAFKTRDEAEKYVRDLKRETGFSAFVTAAK